MFAVKFNNQVVFSRTAITQQETVTVTFDNSPGQHTLDLILFSAVGSECAIAVGNFKINHFDCFDHLLYAFFLSEKKFNGIIDGTSKVSLNIDTPLIGWLQKTAVY
jgi:hypothetical protein